MAKLCLCFLIICLGLSFFFLKEQASFNFMAAVTICSDFGAQENKICHCFHFFPIYLPRSDVGLGLRNSSHPLPNGQTLGNNSLWSILARPSGQQQKLNREGMWKGVHTPNAERNVHEHLLSSGRSHQNHLLFLQFPMKSRIRSNEGHGQALGFWSQPHLCYLAMGSASPMQLPPV